MPLTSNDNGIPWYVEGDDRELILRLRTNTTIGDCKQAANRIVELLSVIDQLEDEIRAIGERSWDDQA